MYPYLVSLVLLALSATFSGLTIGLMSLNVHALERKAKLGDPQAKKIYPVRKNGNLLLTTLLLGNVAVNAVLAIYLSSLFAGVVASFIATAMIFLLGEIVPQASISRHAMRFGAASAWFVQAAIFLLYPICAPIAWVLDKALGDELPTVFSKEELIRVIDEHEQSHASDLDQDEAAVIKGALTFSNKTVEDVMTPKIMVWSVDIKEKLTPGFVKELANSGHSRFPVYEDNESNIVGILYLNKLVGQEFEDSTVEDFYTDRLRFVHEEDKLDDVLNTFFKTRLQLFMVVDEFGGLEGIITLEDILEEIVGREIVDEFDRHTDMREAAKKRAAQRIEKRG